MSRAERVHVKTGIGRIVLIAWNERTDASIDYNRSIGRHSREEEKRAAF
jgi:hypothetical protein